MRITVKTPGNARSKNRDIAVLKTNADNATRFFVAMVDENLAEAVYSVISRQNVDLAVKTKESALASAGSAFENGFDHANWL